MNNSVEGHTAKGIADRKNNPNYDRTGDKNPMFGRTGEKSPLFGRKHTEATKRKMSEAKLRRRDISRALKIIADLEQEA